MSILRNIILLLLLIAFPCFAGDHYIAQTAAGSGDGSSCANADAIADLIWTGAGDMVNAGGTLHLCGTITSTLTIGDSGSAESGYITIKFEDGAKLSKAYWGTTSSAAIYGSSKNYIIIDGGTNGIIESTNNGSASLGYANKEDSRGVYTQSCSNLEIKNLTIRNMYIREANSPDPMDYATLISIIGGSNVSVHDNILNNGVTGIGFSYPGSTTSSNWSAYNNIITAASNGITIGSGNTNAILDSCSIYNNSINLGQTWSGYYAYSGTHTGGNGEAALTDSAHTFYDETSYVGRTLTTKATANDTTYSSCVITEKSDHSLTCTLAGDDGTVWNTGMTWFIDALSDGHFHNDGIQAWAYHTGAELTNYSVYNNQIGPDMGYFVIGETYTSQTTSWIYTEGKAISPKIFNNLLTSTGHSYPTNGYIAFNDGGYGQVTPSAYNNTIIAGGGGLSFGSNVKNTTIKNNIYSGTGNWVSESSLANFISDYNNIYGTNSVAISIKRFTYDTPSDPCTWTNCESVTCTSGGTAVFFRKDGVAGTIELREIVGTCASGDTVTGASGSVALTNNGSTISTAAYPFSGAVSSWQAQTCQDANSVTGDPLFVSSSDYHLQSGSPARDAGVDLSLIFTTDLEGNTRSAWDIGAYEYDTTAPTIPSFTVDPSGAFVTIQGSEDLAVTTGAGYTMSSDGDAVTLAHTSISGTDIIQATSRTILSTETLTYSYTGTDTKDLSGNELAAITDEAVTNSSTQSGAVTGQTTHGVTGSTIHSDSGSTIYQ